MKDWSCATGEHDSVGDYKNNDIENETENEQHLGKNIFRFQIGNHCHYRLCLQKEINYNTCL